MAQDFTDREKQIRILKDFIKSNPEPRELRRAIAVKLALEGYVYRRIKKILEVSIGFISKWKTPEKWKITCCRFAQSRSSRKSC